MGLVLKLLEDTVESFSTTAVMFCDTTSTDVDSYKNLTANILSYVLIQKHSVTIMVSEKSFLAADIRHGIYRGSMLTQAIWMGNRKC